jgi:hypothetical protein
VVDSEGDKYIRVTDNAWKKRKDGIAGWVFLAFPVNARGQTRKATKFGPGTPTFSALSNPVRKAEKRSNKMLMKDADSPFGCDI